MVKALDEIPYNQRQWGHFFSKECYNTKQKLGLGVPKNGREKLADELHKPIKRNFARRRVVVNHIDEIWCSDLAEMQQLSKWNKGYRYLLMVLDVFSKLNMVGLSH